MNWTKGTKDGFVDIEDQLSNIFRSLKNVIFEEPHTYFAINIEGDILWWWWR